jgi:hypothetical protein
MTAALNESKRTKKRKSISTDDDDLSDESKRSNMNDNNSRKKAKVSKNRKVNRYKMIEAIASSNKIITTMRTQSDNPEIQANCLKELIDKVQNEQFLLSSTKKIIEVAIATMQKYETNETIQDYGSNLLLLCASFRASVIRSLGGVELLMKTMRKYQNNEYIQRLTCAALTLLAIKDDKCNQIFGSNGGIALIKHIVVTYKENKCTQVVACRSLYLLAKRDANHCQQIQSLGLIELIVDIMRSNRCCYDVYMSTLFVQIFHILTALVQGNAQYCGAIRNCGAVENLLNTMKDLGHDDDVIGYGFRTLGVLSRVDKECKKIMIQNGVIELINITAHSFGVNHAGHIASIQIVLCGLVGADNAGTLL